MESQVFSNVDDVVRMSIENLFPDQMVPDQENYRADGTQFKAPDHAVLNGKVLIERKSRNPRGGSNLYERLQAIAQEQGAPFRAYGKINIGNVISSLPDPTRANQQIVDFLLGQTMKIVRKAKLKFEEYHQERGEPDQIRILIIADHSDMMEATATTEQFLGRKMGGYDQTKDETGLIDAVFFVKHPALTIDEQNSYWFKAIIKRVLDGENRKLVEGIAATMHQRLSNYGPYNAAAGRFTQGRYRPLIA